MLDMHSYKMGEENTIQAEMAAKRILAEELKGNYDISTLIGADQSGNLWIYSSEEAKQETDWRAGLVSLNSVPADVSDAESGYSSDDGRSDPGETQ